MTESDIKNMTYDKRCMLLNSNPVIVAKHYPFRLETFFTKVLFSNEKPLESITFYAIRIEFQMRDSAHAHILLWTADCPALTAQTKTEFINYVDKHIQAFLPDKHSETELHDVVLVVELSQIQKSCLLVSF